MRLRDMLYELETVEGAGEGGGVATIEGTEVGAGETDAGLGVVPGEETAVEETGAVETPAALTRDDLQSAVGDAFASLVERVEHEDRARAAQQQEQQQREQTPALPEWDPFNPQVVQAHIMAGIKPVFDALIERFSPALEVAGDYRNTQGEQEANSLMDELGKELGSEEFDRGRAVQHAAMLMNQQGADPEQAMRSAVDAQIKFEQEVEQRGVERWKAQAQNLANQGEEPAGGNGAAGEVVTHRRGSVAYSDQLKRSLAARDGRGVGTPTG